MNYYLFMWCKWSGCCGSTRNSVVLFSFKVLIPILNNNWLMHRSVVLKYMLHDVFHTTTFNDRNIMTPFKIWVCLRQNMHLKNYFAIHKCYDKCQSDRFYHEKYHILSFRKLFRKNLEFHSIDRAQNIFNASTLSKNVYNIGKTNVALWIFPSFILWTPVNHSLSQILFEFAQESAFKWKWKKK